MESYTKSREGCLIGNSQTGECSIEGSRTEWTLAMAAALALRDDLTAARMRALARSTRGAKQVRRLLALATIYEGGSRGDALRHRT
jgi:hypothetical protein